MIWIKTVEPKWFDFVSTRPDFEEVNLWTPTGLGAFTEMQPGDLVLFHVRGRRGWISGYGTFAGFARYLDRDAWEIFGEQNGAGAFNLFVEQIEARRKVRHEGGYVVACHNIVQPIYLDSLKATVPFVALQRLGPGPIPEKSEDGRLLLACIRDGAAVANNAVPSAFSEGPGNTRSVKLGRSGFRMGVTEAYGRTCAITGETALLCLDSAHFVPDRLGGPMIVQNGLLIRRDFHPLVEAGFMTVSDDHRLIVSAWLPKTYRNSQYAAFHLAPIRLPENRHFWPDPELLRQHRSQIFFRGGSLGS